jgi:hypothetical protein
MHKSNSLEILLARISNAHSVCESVKSDWGKKYWTLVLQRLQQKLDNHFV